MYIFKELLPVLLKSLNAILNDSLEEGVFLYSYQNGYSYACT